MYHLDLTLFIRTSRRRFTNMGRFTKDGSSVKSFYLTISHIYMALSSEEFQSLHAREDEVICFASIALHKYIRADKC